MVCTNSTCENSGNRITNPQNAFKFAASANDGVGAGIINKRNEKDTNSTFIANNNKLKIDNPINKYQNYASAYIRISEINSPDLLKTTYKANENNLKITNSTLSNGKSTADDKGVTYGAYIWTQLHIDIHSPNSEIREAFAISNENKVDISNSTLFGNTYGALAYTSLAFYDSLHNASNPNSEPEPNFTLHSAFASAEANKNAVSLSANEEKEVTGNIFGAKSWVYIPPTVKSDITSASLIANENSISIDTYKVFSLPKNKNTTTISDSGSTFSGSLIV